MRRRLRKTGERPTSSRRPPKWSAGASAVEVFGPVKTRPRRVAPKDPPWFPPSPTPLKKGMWILSPVPHTPDQPPSSRPRPTPSPVRPVQGTASWTEGTTSTGGAGGGGGAETTTAGGGEVAGGAAGGGGGGVSAGAAGGADAP